MTKPRVSACAFVVAASLASCTGTGDVEYAGEVRVTSPELVEIRPGVQVVADADEPLFYSSGSYWLYRDGYWFRSRDYRGGYARVEYTVVPEPIRVIEQPQVYVHYRSNLGRTHHARTPQTRTRSTQPTYQAPSQSYDTQPAPSTYPPATQRNTNPALPTPAQTYPVPSETPDYPTDPHSAKHPNVPGAQPDGANPTQPTTPPAANGAPTSVPNDHRREPQPQRDVPADIDRTAPGNSANAPGHTKDKPNPKK